MVIIYYGSKAIVNSLHRSDDTSKEQAKPKEGSANPEKGGKPFSEGTKDRAREESDNTCVFCGKETTRDPGPDQSNIDHAIPKSRGGDNTLDNAQNTCRTCNQDKGIRTTDEYLHRVRNTQVQKQKKAPDEELNERTRK